VSETVDTYLLLRAFVDELARCAIAGACTSPGSRSTPMVLSLARDGRFPCTSHVDERAAAFYALGLAKATGRPAVMTCTSGTAAAHYYPAVIEAREARVPLIVLTTDRPPELRDVGAGQTVDQLRLFGPFAKWFVEVGTHPHSPERERWIRGLACRAVWTALGDRPGVVHLNFPLREPLVLEAPLPADERPHDAPPSLVRHPAPAADPRALHAALHAAGASRPVIVAGRQERGAPVAAPPGVPVLADPLSGARRGPTAVAHYDALLRDAGFAAGVTPDLIVRTGDLPTSKPLRQWLARLGGVPQWTLDPEGAWHDPDGVVTRSFVLDPASALRSAPLTAQDGWADAWTAADARAAAALDEVLGDALNEPNIARALATAVVPGAHVLVAASMPIRDVETFWPAMADPPRALANRGANGIDGTLATAYGLAAGSGAPTYVLLGDVAFAHDLGALLTGRRLGGDLTVVVVDNAGGGIFDFLPVATQRDHYEEHVLTPTGLDVARAAALFGARYAAIDELAGLREALGEPPRGTTILHVRTERAANVALHRRCWEAVATAVGA
jgi:2-succinyl-5-enolpyruvyl-6-hydroxy-3-cyclohexene-1-carboxylate synthase